MLQLTKKLTLIVNPILTTTDIRIYHNCSERQSQRLMNYYRDLSGFKIVTYLDFYLITGAFPDKNFHPEWKEINVPTKNAISDNNDKNNIIRQGKNRTDIFLNPEINY